MVRSHSRLPISLQTARPVPAIFSGSPFSETGMLKFLGTTAGIIFLIGLVVVIVVLNLIF